MTPADVCGLLLGLFALLVIAGHCWQTVLWERKERVWASERARLVDAVLAKNSGDFRVRQTSTPVDFEDPSEPRTAQPNRRAPRPVPIGLDGGAM